MNSPSPLLTSWQSLQAGSTRRFHAYGHWLAGISWKRFFLLSVLLMIGAGVLSELVPGSWTEPELHRVPVKVRETVKAAGRDGVSISIDDKGVRIRSRGDVASGVASGAASGVASNAASSAGPGALDTASDPASGAASSPARGAARHPSSVDITPKGIDITLPPGAEADDVREAIADAREALQEQREALQEQREALKEERITARTRVVRAGDSLPPLAFFFIVLSAILKIAYQGRVRAEVQAAAATQTAESEQLKRQVVEARMAAMQAQVEPHFLFNTLASIDHLIETDPARASLMQKNLIAMLRASMPAMRENHPAAHNLGREMAVVRPYLEILKVRMEDRLKTEIEVPEGLLSAEFPSMMIQSLVENAIKHGLEPQPEGGTLSVRAEVQHGRLAVTVADTGMGFGKAATSGTGIGLTNIRERLQLLYGSRAAMTVSENLPRGTRVTLVVPYQAQSQDDRMGR